MDFLTQGILAITWKQVVMFVIGGLLIWLALKKQYGTCAALAHGLWRHSGQHAPFRVCSTRRWKAREKYKASSIGCLKWAFDASEAMPLLLFIGIGAMIDFGPVLSNPKLLLFGAAAQFGMFLTITVAALLGFDLIDAASIGIIGAADGPTSILVSQVLGSQIHRRHRRGGILVYGTGAHHTALCHQAVHHEKRTAHPHDIRAQERDARPPVSCSPSA